MRNTLCKRIHWRYIVLDEGHRIKNEKTSLYHILSQVRTPAAPTRTLNPDP